MARCSSGRSPWQPPGASSTSSTRRSLTCSAAGRPSMLSPLPTPYACTHAGLRRGHLRPCHLHPQPLHRLPLPSAQELLDPNFPSLPTSSSDEFRPFVRCLPTFKFWGYNHCSERIAYLVFCLHKLPSNWPEMIMRHLLEDHHGSLPFDPLFSHVFMLHRIPVDLYQVDSSVVYFDKHTLARMKHLVLNSDQLEEIDTDLEDEAIPSYAIPPQDPDHPYHLDGNYMQSDDFNLSYVSAFGLLMQSNGCDFSSARPSPISTQANQDGL